MADQNNKSVHLIYNQIYKIIQNFSTKYKYTIQKYDKSPNTIIIKPINMTPEMIYNMYDYIFKQLSSYYFPNSIFKSDTETTKSARYKRILVNANNDISIKFFISADTSKKPYLLRPGMAFEAYFVSIIKEEIVKLKELQKELGTPLIPLHIFNLTLDIFNKSTRKTISIDKIVDIKHIGGSNQKPDAQINRRLKPNIKISLKQENFGIWSSANRYRTAFDILNKNVEENIITLNKNISNIVSFDGDVNGLYVKATIDEIKKYCFGEGLNQVDYVVISSYFQGIDENKVIHIESNKVYKKGNISDILKMQSDVFLLISENPEKNASGVSPYRGLDIQFVNSSSLNTRGKKYVKGIR